MLREQHHPPAVEVLRGNPAFAGQTVTGGHHGVLDAGATQIALKRAAAGPSVPVALAGAGPLLLLVACRLLDARAAVAGIVETSPSVNRVAALRHLPAALAAPEYLRTGLRMTRRLRIRPFPDALYRPPEWINAPADETVVCRCEEVTAGRVREMARLGWQGPNQTKFFSRCGMGPCQGRIGGLAVTPILARELGKPPAAVGACGIRAPLKPVPLSSLASLAGRAHEDAVT